MKKIVLLALCALVLNTPYIRAQDHKCGAEILKNMLVAQDPANAERLLQRSQELAARTEAFEMARKGAAMKTTEDAVTIPVVFHIVLNSTQLNHIGGEPGVRQRVFSQMTVLNQDYLKENTDTSRIPSAFKPLAARAGIRFALAHRTPQGLSTEGFEITTTNAPGYDIEDGYGASAAKYASSGGADSWDTDKYLNIWVVNIVPSGILGFTSPPSFLRFTNMPRVELGIVLNYGAFGKRSALNQYFISGIDRGRTLTHEIGHYFELEHIWGDDEGLCPGNGGKDDGIADTPPQGDQNFGNPTFPKISCSNGPNGDMFMNYMDYVNDASMYMFTIDQVSWMKAQLASGANSYTLTQHPELTWWPTSVAGIEQEETFTVYPNPSTGQFRINLNGTEELKQITVLNAVGQLVSEIRINNQQISNYDIDLTGRSKGVYIVQCTFAAGTVTKKIVLQ